jgi:PST family polysaccharide transporter
MARYLLRHSWHFIAADLLVTIYTQMDRIMVQNLGNDHQMGLYSAAMLISNLWIFVPNALLDSGRPLIMEVQKGEEFESKFIRICCLIQWVCILAGAGFTCFGHIVIRIIYGEAYAGAGKALIWLIWSKLFSQMGAARSLWMLCEGTEKYIKYFVGFGAAVNLSMNAWLIPRYGAAGAAAATFFTEFLSSWAATGAWAGTRAYFRIWNRSLFYAKKLIQKRRNG